jgi:hypothetical protein
MELLDENFKTLKEKSQKYAAGFVNRASLWKQLRTRTWMPVNKL